MKYSDDYTAKLKLWATEARAHPVPKLSNVPRFGFKKFNSYEELNAWKKVLVEQIIRGGGAQWTT